MAPKSSVEATIRLYLLGRLSEPELSQIERELFFNEDLSRTASLIEDEIIDQYLDEELDPREQKSVQTHFLRPPAHRQKLRFARLLRSHLKPQAAPLPAGFQNAFSFLRNYGTIVVAFAFGISSLSLGIAWWRATTQIYALKQQVQAQKDSPTAPVLLSLKYGVTRGSVPLRQVVIQPAARSMKVDLLLSARFADSFDIRLLDRQRAEPQEVWSKKDVKPVPSQPRLKFDMPTQGIRTGTYDIVVKDPISGASVTYPFDAAVNQSPSPQ